MKNIKAEIRGDLFRLSNAMRIVPNIEELKKIEKDSLRCDQRSDKKANRFLRSAAKSHC